MNKQPFYHCGYLNPAVHPETMESLREKAMEIIKKTKFVLKDSIDLHGDEMLFTATQDVSEIINSKFKKAKISLTDFGFDAEPGDPADLM